MALKVLQVGAGGWGERWCQDFLPRAVRLRMLEVADSQTSILRL